MTNRAAWLAVAGMILLTVCGQFIIKWRVGTVDLSNRAPVEKLFVLLRVLADPWVLSALAGGLLASICWMAAMTRLPLSIAYPFTSLSFPIVMLIGIVFLNEALTLWKILGVLLVVFGLFVLSQSSN